MTEHQNQDHLIGAAEQTGWRPLTCWGLSSFCAEAGHKCRAAGTCIYAPPDDPGPPLLQGDAPQPEQPKSDHLGSSAEKLARINAEPLSPEASAAMTELFEAPAAGVDIPSGGKNGD